MKLLFVIFLSFLLSLLHCSFLYSNTSTEHFFVGLSKVDITPPVGYPHRNGKSTGVGSPLFAKALVFKQGNNIGAIIICDLISIPRSLSTLVRIEVSEKTNIPYKNISISATHTHTSAKFDSELYFHFKPHGILTDEDRESYPIRLLDNIVNSVVLAKNNMVETELLSGYSQVKGVAFNRRYLLKDGSVRCNPGYLNPNIIKPVGPVDEDVHFILFKNITSNSIVGSLSVFACHTDTRGGTKFHGDYPYFIDQTLKNSFGDSFISVFGIGTSGNVNHADVTKPKRQKGRISQDIGERIGYLIIDEFPKTQPSSGSFNVLSETINLPLQNLTEPELELAWGKVESPKRYEDRETKWIKSKIRHIEKLRQYEAIKPTGSDESWLLPIEVHVFKLNSHTVIVTMPGELFVELGLEIKKKSPFKNTLIIQLANSRIAYVPTKKAFNEGDYEVVNSRLESGSGEIMVKKSIEMLNKMFYNN